MKEAMIEIVEIVVPKLGMSQAQATVVEWTRPDGDRVAEGDVVVVIETAKVAYEIPAPAAGLVFRIFKEKTKANIGQALGAIAETREAFEAYRAVKGKPGAAKAEAGGLFGDDEPAPGGGIELVFGDDASGFDAGRDGQAAPSWLTAPPQVEIDLTDRKIKRRQAFAGMRRTIADNLQYSLHSGAQLTVFAQADLTELALFREELKLDRPDAKITFVDMLVKLLPAALAEHPILNSAVVGDEIVIWDECHIGVAVALDGGLVVPVVRNADKKSLAAVSREIKKLAGRARAGELAPEDYQGGTFTLSSGGPVEIEFVTPIINPPENAILGLGKIAPRPVVVNGELAVRTTVWLCLTHDHRVVDGVPAAMFLGRLKQLIETPGLFRKILR
jgi:pyruvate/2-oxoglutarate dehydrogenase complex dihydrolipoamide acyltransferase (E2) component